MTVTQIVEMSKARSKVYIDQEFAFVLYKGELRHFHIKEGGEISDQDYRLLTEEILPKRAKLRCMNLLKNREYTRAQLRDKLKQGCYPEKVMEEALDYVASYRYIDDERYALDFITYNHGSKSRRRIENDLLAKGISRQTIQKMWNEWEADGNQQDECAQIESWLRKKHFDGKNMEAKEKQKIFAFLMRKGFSTENIRRVLNKFGEDDTQIAGSDYFYLT